MKRCGVKVCLLCLFVFVGEKKQTYASCRSLLSRGSGGNQSNLGDLHFFSFRNIPQLNKYQSITVLFFFSERIDYRRWFIYLYIIGRRSRACQIGRFNTKIITNYCVLNELFVTP